MVRCQKGPSLSKTTIMPLARRTSIPLDFPAPSCGSRSRRSSRKVQLVSPTKRRPLPGQLLEPSGSEVEQEAFDIDGGGAALASSAALSLASPCKQEQSTAVFVQDVSPSSPQLHHRKDDHSGQDWPLQCWCTDSGTLVGRMEAPREACIPLLRASSLHSDGTWSGDSLASAELVRQLKVQQLQIIKQGAVRCTATQQLKDAFRRPRSSEFQHSTAVPSPHICAWKAYQSKVQRIASRHATQPPVEIADVPLAQEKLAMPSTTATAFHLATEHLAVESADYPILLGQEQQLQASGTASTLATNWHCSSPSETQTSRSREAQEAHVSTGSNFPARSTRKPWYASLLYSAEKRSPHRCASVSARAWLRSHRHQSTSCRNNKNVA